MSDFLLIHGMPIPVAAGGSPDVDYQERGGEIVPAFAGNLLSSVKGHARTWRVQTPALSESDARYYDAMLRSPGAVPVDGRLTGGPVLAFVRGLRMRPVAKSGGERWVVEFEMHESAPRLPDGNLLRNPGFEEGGDYWGVPLSTSWLGPGAGAEVAITDGGSDRSVLPTTPLSDLEVAPGQMVSVECDMIADPGVTARMNMAFRDSVGATITTVSTGPYTDPAWSRRGILGTPIPANAASVQIYYRGAGVGTARFRNATFGPGSTAPPWQSAAVMHDPARAHGGSRYLETYAAPGAANRINQTEAAASGVRAYYPVQPGDVVTFGGWVLRISGDGNPRIEVVALNASKEDSAFVNAGNVAVPAWTYTERAYVALNQTASVAQNAVWTHLAGRIAVPEGVAYVYLQAAVLTPTVATTARFDDVFLRIRRAGA